MSDEREQEHIAEPEDKEEDLELEDEAADQVKGGKVTGKPGPEIYL
jgi:hypothetical protein